jgi:hypothetical protein
VGLIGRDSAVPNWSSGAKDYSERVEDLSLGLPPLK